MTGPLRVWAAVMVALFPPDFRAAVGRDLARLLVDEGRRAVGRGAAAGVWYVTANTMRCAADAAGEWVGAFATFRHEGRGGGMRDLGGWIRTAVRGLLRRPSYSIPAVATVALGIGANTAMFSVLYGVVLRPLPYPAAEELVQVFPAEPAGGDRFGAFSLLDLRDWQERTTRLAALGAYTTLPSGLVLTGGDEAVEVETAYVTPGVFEAVGTAPLLGRTPTAADEETDDRVLVLSHGLWLRRYGGDPDVVGRTVSVGREPWRVVGVMPDGFAFPDPSVEVWTFLSVIPESSIPLRTYRSVRLLDAVGRLAPGVSLDEATAELSAVAASLAEEYPESNGTLRAATVRSLHEGVVGDVRRSLAVLMAAALVILAVVCANVANLALAREARRASDLAVRTALGAGRGRLMGLVVTESLVVGLVGGALGLVLAVWGTGALAAAGSTLLPRAAEIGLDWPVALFSLAASVATGVAFALLPGLRAARGGVAGTLRSSGRSVTGRARGTLVAAQVALAVVLVVGAGLLARSLAELGRVDPGFRPSGLVVADLTFPATRYEARADYLPRFDATLEALARVPGVTAVGAIRQFPFVGRGEQVDWSVPGRVGDGQEGTPGRILQVEGDAFQALGARFEEGGPFDAHGDAPPPVAVVNRTLAARAFGGGSALGRAVIVDGTPLEVVGVVADIRQSRLDALPSPTLYIPNRLSPRRGAAFMVRVAGGDDAAAAAVREVRAALNALDPDQAVRLLAAAPELVGGELARPRFFAVLLGLLAGLALALSAVGVYGVVAFGVVERRGEVGIRMALGATAGQVVRLVVRQGMTPVLLGGVLGVAGAAVLVRALSGLLYGVEPWDPVSYAVALAVLTGVGLVACWLPGRSASRTPPREALTADA